MQNLKTIKIHSLRAHLDRIQMTAEAMAALASGEVLAGRLSSCQEMARLSSALLSVRAALEAHAAMIHGPAVDDN